jgi:hypothetical protein
MTINILSCEKKNVSSSHVRTMRAIEIPHMPGLIAIVAPAYRLHRRGEFECVKRGSLMIPMTLGLLAAAPLFFFLTVFAFCSRASCYLVALSLSLLRRAARTRRKKRVRYDGEIRLRADARH